MYKCKCVAGEHNHWDSVCQILCQVWCVEVDVNC